MPRLPQGVRRKEKGGYEKRFTVDGKRFSVTAGSLKELEAREKALIKDIENGLDRQKERITLDAYYKEWQAGREGTVKQSTMYTQNRQYRHISASLGSKKVKAIQPGDCKRLQKELQQKTDKNGEPLLTARGVNLIMSLLKSILNEAERERIISWNPACTVKPVKVEADKKDATETIHRALTAAEKELFFKYAKTTFYYNYYRFLLATGMRSGEAAALKWADIDYTAGVIHITKTVSRISDSEVTITAPKTRGSKRDIPLTDEAKAILADVKHNGLKKIIPIDERIFTTTDGAGIIRTTSIATTIKVICRKATNKGEPLEPFGAHAFRDTWASDAIRAGVPREVVQQQLGHESYHMTEHYVQTDLNTMQTALAHVTFCG